MPTFSRHDIDTMGFKAAEEFSNGSSLHSSLVKIAQENSMNPEQIKRLVESANTTTFLNEFKGKSGNQRMVEFDVADPSKVINEALGSTASPSKPSININITIEPDSGLHDTVTDENTSLPPYEEVSDKVASYIESKTTEEDYISLDINQASRVKDNLLSKLAHCNYTASDIADEIAFNFKNIYSRDKYASFELDCLASYGNSAIPGLQMVRNRLGMSKIANKLSPQQAYILSDRHVVENSANLEKLSSILDNISEYSKLTKGLEYVAKVVK